MELQNKGIHFIYTDTKRVNVFNAIKKLLKNGYVISYDTSNISEIQLINRMLCYDCGIDFNRIKQGNISEDELNLISNAAQRIAGYDFWLNERNLTDDIDSFIFDYINESKVSYDDAPDKWICFLDCNLNPKSVIDSYNNFCDIKTPIVVVHDLSINN